jgi:hypothetical protein
MRKSKREVDVVVVRRLDCFVSEVEICGALDQRALAKLGKAIKSEHARAHQLALIRVL